MIVQECDMKNNSGSSSYRIGDKVFFAQQHHNVFEVFINFIDEIKPDKILEIGTALGGLTGFLNHLGKNANPNFQMISIDIHNREWYKDLINDGVDIIIENIFDWDEHKITNQKVIDFLSDDKRKIILCDGGNKVQEFKILSQYLNSGDFIMAHDYVDTDENFRQNYAGKIWNWKEIGDSNIDESCARYGLESYKKEIFDSVVWACKQKK